MLYILQQYIFQEIPGNGRVQSSVNNATDEGIKGMTGKPQKFFLRYCKKVLTFNNL